MEDISGNKINNIDNYSFLRDNVDKYMNLKKKAQENLKKNEKKQIFDECCVCYLGNETFIIKTTCNHYICMPCIYKLNKHECPMCRSKFPEEIIKILPKKNTTHSSSNYGILNSDFNWSGTPMLVNPGLRMI
jgi:hypothetical protein